jgi:hypothetical protein
MSTRLELIELGLGQMSSQRAHRFDTNSVVVLADDDEDRHGQIAVCGKAIAREIAAGAEILGAQLAGIAQPASSASCSFSNDWSIRHTKSGSLQTKTSHKETSPLAGL